MSTNTVWYSVNHLQINGVAVCFLLGIQCWVLGNFGSVSLTSSTGEITRYGCSILFTIYLISQFAQTTTSISTLIMSACPSTNPNA